MISWCISAPGDLKFNILGLLAAGSMPARNWSKLPTNYKTSYFGGSVKTEPNLCMVDQLTGTTLRGVMHLHHEKCSRAPSGLVVRKSNGGHPVPRHKTVPEHRHFREAWIGPSSFLFQLAGRVGEEDHMVCQRLPSATLMATQVSSVRPGSITIQINESSPPRLSLRISSLKSKRSGRCWIKAQTSSLVPISSRVYPFSMVRFAHHQADVPAELCSGVQVSAPLHHTAACSES